MTVRFVDSGASGANNGTSWANAWTAETSSVGVAAGDEIRVHKTHDGTVNNAIVNWVNGTLAAKVRIVCVDKNNGDALATGAKFKWGTTAVGPAGSLYCRGVTLSQSAADLLLIPPNNGHQVYETCRFVHTGTSALQGSQTTARYRIDFINTDVDFSGAGSANICIIPPCTTNCFFNWKGGTYTPRGTQTRLFVSNNPCVCRIRGVKFLGTVSNVITGASALGLWEIDGCAAPNYTTVGGGAFTAAQFRMNLDGFVQSGSALLRPNVQTDAYGALGVDSARWRTGGADFYDQPNILGLTLPYCWAVTTSSNSFNLYSPFECTQIGFPVSAGSHTLTFYVASGVTLNNDEAWVDVMSPDEAVVPTPQSVFRTTRADPLATPAPLTSDNLSQWNGSGLGVQQKITVTINPTTDGVVWARFNLAKPTTTAYFDPKVVVT